MNESHVNVAFYFGSQHRDRDTFHSAPQCPDLPGHKNVTWISVLQCVAVCCSVLQCVAVCCSVLQCVARSQERDMNESRHAYETLIRIKETHIWKRHVSLITHMKEIHHRCVLFREPALKGGGPLRWAPHCQDRMSHVTHMNESRHTYEKNTHVRETHIWKRDASLITHMIRADRASSKATRLFLIK